MESSLVEGGVKLLQAVGFPVVVCGWFMFRMEKKLDEQTAVLHQIALLLAKLNDEPSAA